MIDLTTDRPVSTGKASGPPKRRILVSDDGRKVSQAVQAGVDVFDTSAFT